MKNADHVVFCDLLAKILPLYNKAMNESFSSQSVTPVQANLLFELEKSGRSKVTDLAEQLDTPTSNISNIATRLEKMHLVVRKRNEIDRRIVELELSEEAPLEIVKLAQAKSDFFEKIESAIPGVDFEQLNQSLEQVKLILNYSINEVEQDD